MPASISSVSRRDRPTGRMRRAPPTRSTSFLGTLKSLVRPLATWLGSQEETEDDAQGKRRMVDQEIQDDEFGNTVQHRHKRKRIDSPEPHQDEADQLPPLQQNKFNQVQGGYLDPSSGLFNPPQSAQPGAAAHGRSSSLAVPSTSRPSFRLGRHSFSPQPTASYGRLDTMVRTQSMDPPRRNDATVVSIPLSRDASMSGIPPSPIHESSLSPSRTRFRMRTSLTPQPSGQSFGPTPVRRERNPSEPPPLEALMAHPIFVRPPESQAEPIQREQSLTLGNLVEAHRASNPLVRQSSLVLGTQNITLSERLELRPINAAEKALQELDVYKTPLLPSRLRGSTTIPDMFKHKQSTAPVLMKGDRGDRPRLGTSEKVSKSAKRTKGKSKGKDKTDSEKSSKPYAGQGGMKKLLARRKLEEEEEKEKELEDKIVEDEEAPKNVAAKTSAEEIKGKELQRPQVREFPARIGGRIQSSLRVGRTSTRSHVRSAIPSKAKSKFSARFDEDEVDDQMEDTVNVPEPPKATLFESPAGFSFAKDTPTIQHDTTGAKEPPIKALPYSLSKTWTSSPPIQPMQNRDLPASRPRKPIPVSAPASSTSVPAPAPMALFDAVPSIALIPPSPGQPSLAVPSKPAGEQLEAKETQSTIPNFFKNSSFLKADTTVPNAVASTERSEAPPSTSLFAPTSTVGQPAEPISAQPASTEPAQSTLASSTQPVITSTPSGSLFGVAPSPVPPAPSLEKKEEKVPVASGFSFGPPPAKIDVPSAAPSFNFGPPAPKADDKPLTSLPFSFGPKAEERPVAASTPAPFSFGPKSDEKPASASTFSFAKPTSSSAPSSNAPFTFGSPTPAQPTKEEVKPPTTSDTYKPSPFGPISTNISTTTTPFAFGASSATATPSKPSTAPFAFGGPSTPSVETPKPLFSTTPSATPASPFNFGQPSSSATDTAKPSPFSFGSTPATPVAEKKPFTFGPPPTSSSGGSMLFGGQPASGSVGSDVSKAPFAFGATPTRPVTPPRDSEVTMDESPTRGNGMDLNGNNSTKPSGFSFGFGQNAAPPTSSQFSFGVSNTSTSGPFGSKPEVKPPEKLNTSFSGFGQPTSASSSPFSFGQKPDTQPNSTGFSFGQSAGTPTSTNAPFSFGSGTSTAAPSNVFGGTSQPAANSAPTSPFAQSNPFSFGASSAPMSAPPTSSSPFAFGGSQPASPATASAGLPQPPGSSGGFTFGSGPSAAPASTPSPFGAPTPLPPSGGAVFNMGSAPPPSGRPMKKMPSRRGGKR